MNDIERAAELASTVLPGPIGEALSDFFNDGIAIEDALRNVHLMKLAHQIVYVDRMVEAVGLVCPEQGAELYHGLALQFAILGEAKTAADATRLAEIAVRHLFAVAPPIPSGHAPCGYVNAAARVLAIRERLASLTAELNDIENYAGGKS